MSVAAVEVVENLLAPILGTRFPSTSRMPTMLRMPRMGLLSAQRWPLRRPILGILGIVGILFVLRKRCREWDWTVFPVNRGTKADPPVRTTEAAFLELQRGVFSP